MTTVSVCKREGFTPFFQRSFDDLSEAARFADSWRPLHVTIHDESGQALDPSDFIRCKGKPSESALQPFKNADGADVVCPFCGAPETPILADDGATLIANEAEQAVIAEIRDWRSHGWTLERIADALTARAVPTKTGKSAHWTHQAVARILKREHRAPTDFGGAAAKDGESPASGIA